MKYLLVLLLLVACTPQKRLTRLLKKNPELEKVELRVDTVTQIINGVDTIYHLSVDTIRIVRTPPTRYEVRYKYKTIKDTVKINVKGKERIIKIKEKREVKKQRSLWWVWLVIGFLFGFIVRVRLH